MKNLDREFRLKERILLLILAAIVLGAIYYYLIHQPVTEGINTAKQQIADLTVEKEALDAKIALLEKMKETNQNPDALELGYMPSYSYSENELRFLNDVLQDTVDYTITFSGLSRDGNQIRRSFNLEYRVKDYNEAMLVLHNLTKTEIRCLIGDMSCAIVRDRVFNMFEGVDYMGEEMVRVNLSATFYETLVGGTPDAALPAE